MLLYLIFLYVVTVVLSFLKILPFNFIDILTTGIYISILSFVANSTFSFIFKATTKRDSPFITALILSLIIGPVNFFPNIFFLTIAPILAMTSKYLIGYRKKHFFNPAAFAVVITATILGKGASWWIGNWVMLPFIILGGVYVLIKIRRLNMTLAFLFVFLLLILITNLKNLLPFHAGVSIILSSLSPVLFFSIVMLTEPMTSPTDQKLRIYYGVICAVVIIILQKVTPISYTIELSLLITNLLGRTMSAIKNRII